ncbi:MAG: hypothetical protein QW767_03480 [Thermoprotei archaeon]
MEPFYFKSYDKVVATASNVAELGVALERLAAKDPACASWHLKQGHVSAWLTSIGQSDLATLLKGITDPSQAALIVKRFQERAPGSVKRSNRRPGPPGARRPEL